MLPKPGEGFNIRSGAARVTEKKINSERLRRGVKGKGGVILGREGGTL